MPAFAPIVLGDGSHTASGFSGAAAGAYTFSPAYIDSAGVATWYTMDTGEVLDAREKITLSVRQPSKGSQVARVTAKLVVPVMDSDDATLKIGEGIATAEFVIPKRMTDTERTKLIYLFANLIQGTGTQSDVTIVSGDQNDFVVTAVGSLASPY